VVSVANSWQNFPVSPVEIFCLREKIRRPLTFWLFEGTLGWRKRKLSVFMCVSEVYIIDVARITEVKRRNTNSKEGWSFSAFSVQNRPNLAADLSSCATFYSVSFELCGRTVGQFATRWWYIIPLDPRPSLPPSLRLDRTNQSLLSDHCGAFWGIIIWVWTNSKTRRWAV
jgi:hypothetical protein